jgi:hypothetical protein
MRVYGFYQKQLLIWYIFNEIQRKLIYYHTLYRVNMCATHICLKHNGTIDIHLFLFLLLENIHIYKLKW